jgi:anti-sigma regulatory factor (Ser/Thr protein kinase)
MMPAQTLWVPWSMSSALTARRELVSELRALEVNESVIDEAEIVISELVANAVRHARALPDGTIRVDWAVMGGMVELEVTDGGGPTVPRKRPRSMWSAHGRGLRIVSSLAHDWGVLEGHGSCTVWVALGGPSRRPSQ